MNIQSLHFVLDINQDGVHSAWEYWEAVKWAYTLPGRLLIESLGNIPVIASAFDIQASAQTGYASLGGLPATAGSLVFWVALMVWLMSRSSGEDTQDAPTPPAKAPPHRRAHS